jgi:ribosome modulation factor
MADRDGPGSDTDKALKIHTAGRQARDQGKPVTACPHPADTQANYQWVSGWMQPSATAPEDASWGRL